MPAVERPEYATVPDGRDVAELDPHWAELARPGALRGGHGLRNMRQRAEACGGSLWSGLDGSAWVVEAGFERRSDDLEADMGRTPEGSAAA